MDMATDEGLPALAKNHLIVIQAGVG